MHDKRVLIIDDDSDFLELAGLLFKNAGAQIFTAADGLEGVSQLFRHRPDLILLDVMMPGLNGFDVCARIQEVSDTPVIILTALQDEHEMLRGLNAGADDFLTKPFNPQILLARAKAVLHRMDDSKIQTDPFHYRSGYLSIDVERRDVLIMGNRIKLTPVEFRLLVYLARNGGKVVTYNEILTTIWGNEHQKSVDYVHIYISHLRNKIEANPKEPRYIVTVRGSGYVFEMDVVSPEQNEGGP